MDAVPQSRLASAPARRQGCARCARRLTPPLTATGAPAQKVIMQSLARLLRSLTTGSKNTKFLILPPAIQRHNAHLAMWLILLGLIVLPERFAEACDAVLLPPPRL